MTPALEVELETKRPRRPGRATAAAVFGAVLAVPMAASGAEAYVPDDGGSPSPSPSNETTSADAAERRAAPEPAPPTPPKPAPEPIQKAPEPAPAPDPEPAPAPRPRSAAVDPKPNEHQALRDVEPEPEPAPEPQRAPEPTPAPEDVKPNEHEALRDLEPAGPPAPEDVKPNEHEALRDWIRRQLTTSRAATATGRSRPTAASSRRCGRTCPRRIARRSARSSSAKRTSAQLEEWEQNPPDYVAMGDSYAAGTGTIPDDEDPPGQRTEDAYGPEIAEARNYDVEHVAYGGATTENVLEGQDDEAPAGRRAGRLDRRGHPLDRRQRRELRRRGREPAATRATATRTASTASTRPRASSRTSYRAASTRSTRRSRPAPPRPRSSWSATRGCGTRTTDDDGNDLAGFTPDEIDELNETADILAVTIGEQAQGLRLRVRRPTDHLRWPRSGVRRGVPQRARRRHGLGQVLERRASPVDDDSFHPERGRVRRSRRARGGRAGGLAEAPLATAFPADKRRNICYKLTQIFCAS